MSKTLEVSPVDELVHEAFEPQADYLAMAKLQLIHEWKNTICVTSKHKEDLVHIRDMHRLLSYKGELFLYLAWLFAVI